MTEPTPQVAAGPAAVEVIPKDWYTSRTVWFNVVTTAVFIAAFAGTAAAGTPQWLVPIASAVYSIGNIVLRVWFTGAPIAGTPTIQ